MAKRRRPKIKVHRTKSEAYLINLRYFGVEPEVDGVQLDRNLRADCLNWYAGMTPEAADAREYIEAWMTQYDPERLSQFKTVPDTRLNYTMAYLMRLQSRGGILPSSSIEFLNNALNEMLRYAVAPVTVAANTVTIQDRLREQASDAMGELNGMIDDGVIDPGWSLYDYATKNGWSGMLAKRIADKLQPIADELLEVLSNPKDKDLQEGYKPGYTKKQLTLLAATYQSMVDDALRYANNAIAARKPRRKRVKSPDQVVKKLAYAKTNDTFKLQSVSPTKIVGCQELWTYNGKTNVLTVFRARTRDGLTVKGSSIVDFDPDTSSAKKMGRKTAERLDKVRDGGKVALRKVMDDFIGTPVKKIGRITKDTVLVRVL